jgi:quercetin dioxygenase-like cupin family protein
MPPHDGLPPLRRVVTGHDGSRACVVMDGAPPNRRSAGPGHAAVQVWCTHETPADISAGADIEDMGLHKLGTPPPANGTRLTVNDIPPGNTSIMHRTETIDYAIVLAGEIEMDLDDSTVKLKAGDIVVQRGTHHAWANRSTEPARIAFVMIDAKPLGIGHPITGMQTVTGGKTAR